MSSTIGQLTFPDDRANELSQFATRVRNELGTKIDPVTIVVKPRAQMKRYRDPKPGDGPNDGRARGYWHEDSRTIDLADDLFAPGQPLDETLGHEVIHALFSDWVTKGHRRQLLPLISPTPTGFGDQSINDADIGYPASPEECCAVWGSAAIFGFDPPAYVGLYKRNIAKANLPTLREILLSDGQGGQGPGVVPGGDPCQQVKDRNAVLEARITEISADLDALLANLGTTAKKAKPQVP
jgi:hypothetical protein